MGMTSNQSAAFIQELERQRNQALADLAYKAAEIAGLQDRIAELEQALADVTEQADGGG